MSGAIPRVLIIGAGATGSCAAYRLKQSLGQKVVVEVWEKARGPGGRMSTNRSDAKDVNLRADMGAQYLSLDINNASCNEVAEFLIKGGVCKDLPDSMLSATPERVRGESWRHLAGATGGVNDALKKLLEEAGATPHYEKRVASIDEQDGVWRARPYEGSPGFFDAVILAVPGCGIGGDNLNKIRGSYEKCFSNEQNKELTSVKHDARWSFAFYLPSSCAAECDSFFGDTAIEKTVEDSTLHLLCYQSRKTMHASGSLPEGGVAIVAHSTIEWANRNSRANGRDQRILSEVAEKVGQFLKIASLNRTALGSKVITWKQCQVSAPMRQGPNGPCMVASSGSPLVLAGDYFSDSSFGGCLKSGFAAADAVSQVLGSSKQECISSKLQDSVHVEASTGYGGKGKGNKDKRQQESRQEGAHNKGKGKGKGKEKGYQREQQWSEGWRERW